jgi:deoxyhypusine synthase
VKTHRALRSGTEQLEKLAHWYRAASGTAPVGFFQIGGGIAGDFAICVVPLLIQDLEEDTRLWAYFAQISDAVTSYGGYSGAVPNEKITWKKLSRDCPKFMIQSDASIVAPLIFAYVLGQ